MGGEKGREEDDVECTGTIVTNVRYRWGLGLVQLIPIRGSFTPYPGFKASAIVILFLEFVTFSLKIQGNNKQGAHNKPWDMVVHTEGIHRKRGQQGHP